MPWLAIVLALTAALLAAIGVVLQQSEAAANTGRGLALLRSLITRPRWLLGYALGFAAVAVAAGALAVGSLLVVQPLGVTTLLFALPLAARFRGHRMTGQQWVAAIVLTVALGAFIGVGNPTEGVPAPPFSAWIVIGAVALGLAAVLGLAAYRLHGPRRALTLGVATGVMFGVQGALTKAVMDIGTGAGVLALVTSWELYALVIMAVISVSLQQLAFQAADLSASEPAIMVITPVAASVCGVVVFDERLQTSPMGWVVVAVAVIAMTWGTLTLAGASSREGVAGSQTRSTWRPSINKLGSLSGINPFDRVRRDATGRGGRRDPVIGTEPDPDQV